MSGERPQPQTTVSDDSGSVKEAGAARGPLALDKTAVCKLEAADASVRMSAVGYLAADHAELRMSPAAIAHVKGPLDLRFSSASLLAAGGDARVQYGACQMVAAKGDVSLNTAMAGAVLSRQTRVERGLVGMLVANDVELADGARVILRPAGAAALGAGFAGGLLFAVAFLWRLLVSGRKRRGRRSDAPETDAA